MAQVSYHGEFPEGKDSIEQHGYTFERDGKPVDVKEDNLLSKFAGNRFFKTSKSDKEQVEQGQDEAEKAEAETLRQYLTEEKVPFRANASLDSLRKLAAEHQDAQEKAREG